MKKKCFHRFSQIVIGSEEYDHNISRGIQLGSKLGKKLQVRGESRETKWTRLDSGRIDKRLVELGFGNESLFNFFY